MPRKVHGEVAADAPATKVELSRYQKWPTVTLFRPNISGVPYNPRHATPAEKKRIRKSIKDHGLMGDPVVNERTEKNGWATAECGHFIVGGHQRIEQMDALEGTDQYAVRVVLLRVSPKKEREANIVLNNPNVGAQYDLSKLDEVMRTPGLDVLATGFERLDLEMMFGGDAFGHLFSEEAAPPRAKKAAKDVAEIADAVKKRRKEYKEQDGARTNDVEYYAVVVFDSTVQRERFMEFMGVDPGMRNVPGRVVAAFMPGLELP